MRTKFLLATALLTTTAFASKPNPADYTLTIHVVGSASVSANGENFRQLIAILNGERIQLTALDSGLLPLGDYPAKKLEGNPKLKLIDASTAYDLLLPDGSHRAYGLSAIGESVPAPR